MRHNGNRGGLLAALWLAVGCNAPPAAGTPDGGAFGPRDPVEPPPAKFCGHDPLTLCPSGVHVRIHLDEPPEDVLSFGVVNVCHQAMCWDLHFVRTESGRPRCDERPGSWASCDLSPEGQGTLVELTAYGAADAHDFDLLVDGDFFSLRVEVGGRVVAGYVGHVSYEDHRWLGRKYCSGCVYAEVEVGAATEDAKE